MTKLFSTFIFLCLISISLSAQVGIGTASPDVSAALDVTATDKGLLIPRVSLASAIPSPAAGLMVHQTTAPAGFYYYNGTAWTMIGAQGPQGPEGPQGPTGAQGPAGAAGPGVPTGGTANQVLTKVDGTDYNTQWSTPSGGADNLGNHTATQNLNMANFDITNVKEIMPARLRLKINQTPHTFTSSNVALWTTYAQIISSNIPTTYTQHTVVKFTCVNNMTMHGFPAGVDGQLLMITNASANELVIQLESTDWGQMADGSQFYDPNGAPVTMSGDGFVLFMYDSAALSGVGAWVIISSTI
ncbi:MAG TPA: hypothetical protein PKD51_18300 [Saprospiraceae bacterium]|nr:hypothetical protein [Saprospiraceae bacterium]